LFAIENDASPEPVVINGEYKKYKNATYGIAFSYPPAYALGENDEGNGERWHHAIILRRKEDAPPAPDTEAPPSMRIDIYQNDLDQRSLQDWLTGTSFSNFKLGDGSYQDVRVDDTEAVSYHWSGLYEGRTVAFRHRDAIIAVTGTFFTQSDALYKDFDTLVRSLDLE
jgi:hypothetical protein